MNVLMLDSSDAKEGDSITLTVGKVMPCDGGFMAQVTPEGAEPTEESPEMEDEEAMPEMSPMAKKVLGK